MPRRARKWWLHLAAFFALAILALAAAAYLIARRFEPLIRQQTIAWLEDRFRCRAELAKFTVRLPLGSPLELILRQGRGARIKARLENLLLRFDETHPPLVAFRRLDFDVDVPSLWTPPVKILSVNLDGLEIKVPPRGSRPTIKLRSSSRPASILLPQMRTRDARLILLPKDPTRAPLIFEIHDLLLSPRESRRPMHYQAELTNAKPPGLIRCRGTFGPWNSEQPSDTPLTGDYTFDKADLSVFRGISGTLASTGRFSGILHRILVDGETRTPDFALTMSGNRVPLSTSFHAIVDGTDGDTILQPVRAKLGQTPITVRGAVARRTRERGKTVDLKVDMPKGRLDDLLTLAMEGPVPIMRGGVALDGRIVVPPGKSEISERVQLAGRFKLSDARFTSPKVQEGIDSLSRRAQGRPKDEDITEVPSEMRGVFETAQGRIVFSDLDFEIPGARVELAGDYVFRTQALDFYGKAYIQARVSQMMKSRWKRWVLKPADPFFAKDGYGVITNVRITGTRDAPRFSR